MSTTTTWVARGDAGTVGTIHREDEGFIVRLRDGNEDRGPFDSLEVAKDALTSGLGPGASRPTFVSH